MSDSSDEEPRTILVELHSSRRREMELYELSPEEKRLVRACYGKDEKDAERSVEEIKRWVEEQIQLPVQAQDGKFIDIMLLRGKFDVERTKTKIENYFKYIRKYPELFTKLGHFKPSEEICAAVNLPKVNEKCERIVVLRFSETALKKFDIEQCLFSALSTAIIMYHKDYHSGVRFLLDFKGFSFLYMTKVTPRLMLKLLMIYEKIVSVRVAGIEIVNAPGYLMVLLKMAKAVLKPKLFSRITLHPDLDSVYQNIPKEYLPSDYGGDLNSSEHYLAIWDDIVESHADFYATIAKSCQTTNDVAEKQTIFAAANNNHFKNLNLD